MQNYKMFLKRYSLVAPRFARNFQDNYMNQVESCVSDNLINATWMLACRRIFL